MDRRDFLRRAALAGAAVAGTPLAAANAAGWDSAAFVIDPADPVAASPAVQWAARRLEQAMNGAGMGVQRLPKPAASRPGSLTVIASGAGHSLVQGFLKKAKLSPPQAPESLLIFSAGSSASPVLVVCGSDARGVSYALTELADRLTHGIPAAVALRADPPLAESALNPVRSIMRQFTSDVLDKPWFNDREMWPQYLGMLAAQRFNRFHLCFGLGYDDLKLVEDAYFLFLYPFLVDVPGYNVRATGLRDGEREENLAMLRYISQQSVACGLDFQLGIWMHGYQYPANPKARHMIEGLTAENHAAYCRDALTAVLKACPAISSVSLRIHGESGVAEGSYQFWRTIFNGVGNCGRKVELDLHAKGIDPAMIDGALATGMAVNVTPKYWAEHLGMPYHQAAIRELEMPVAGRTGAGLMTLSEGSRSSTRYGYADLLRDDRRYTVRHRIFAGTQRILLSGDPLFTAAYARRFTFCNSTGVDVMEPLTCRGRRGTGGADRRDGYLDASLATRWDWEKYSYWYRVWGRMLFNPDSNPEVCQRHFGTSEEAVAQAAALGQASRLLPIVTTAHLPSAACDAYWPELYWNQPLASELKPNPYSDSPAPKNFLNVSPLDPQLFSRIGDFAGELLSSQRSSRYSPLEVAQWLEDLATGATRSLGQAGRPVNAEMRRLWVDVRMQASLGRFFAAKFRAGVLYALFERTNDRRALAAAVRVYMTARDAWSQLVEQSAVYAPDLSASDRISEHGHWRDRLAAIETDIASLRQLMSGARDGSDAPVAAAIEEVLARPRRPAPGCRHLQPEGFRPRQAVPLEVTMDLIRPLESARLYYRHVNQAERFQSVAMEVTRNSGRAAIPADYTDSPYPIMYYFECRNAAQQSWLYPGFTPELDSMPYFVLRRLA